MNSEIKPSNAEIEYLSAPFKVSRIGLGTWAIGGWMWGGTDDTESISAIHEALDRGVTLIDTAPAYGFGHSEEIVGKRAGRGRTAQKRRHCDQGRARLERRAAIPQCQQECAFTKKSKIC